MLREVHQYRLFPGKWTLVILALVLFGAFAQAANASNVYLDTVVGFQGKFKPGHWTPIHITVENKGTAIQGTLQIEVGSGSLYKKNQDTVSYIKPLALPRNSRKRYSFIVMIKEFSDRLRVKIIQNQATLLQKKISLKELAVSERIALGLSREVSLDFLSLVQGHRAGQNRGERFRVIYPYIEYLPDRWYGYSSVDLIVIHDMVLSHLTVLQVEALDQWVHTGGILVISGGAHFSSQDSAVLKPLLPVEITGRLEMHGLPSLSERFEHELRITDPFVISRSRLASGQTILEERSLPLLVAERRGQGKIFFMAFDFAKYPIYNWPGKYELWRSMLDMPKEQTDLKKDSLVYPVVKLPHFSLPSPQILLAVLVGYAVALYILFKMKRSKLIKIFSIVFLALFASAVSFYLFHKMMLKTDLVFLDVTDVQATLNERFSPMRKDILLVSTQRNRYSITLEGNSFAVQQQGPFNIGIEERENIVIRGIYNAGWESRFFRITGMIEFPISGDMVLDGSYVRVSMKNETASSIKDGLFIYRGVPYFVGDFNPGDTIKDTFRFQPGTGLHESEQGPELPWENLSEETKASDELYRAVITHILQNQDWEYLHQGRSMLFTGWVEEPLLRALPGRSFHYAANLNLITVIMPIEEKADVAL